MKLLNATTQFSIEEAAFVILFFGLLIYIAITLNSILQVLKNRNKKEEESSK